MKSKGILGIVTGAITYIYALVSFILSFTVESGAWGRDTHGSKFYIVLMLVGLIILTFSIIALVDLKRGRVDALIVSYCFMIIGTLGFIFYLATVIDMAISAGDALSISELIGAIFNTCLAGILGVYGYLSFKKKSIKND